MKIQYEEKVCLTQLKIIEDFKMVGSYFKESSLYITQITNGDKTPSNRHGGN